MPSIGSDYVVSWRPSPTDTVCAGSNEDLIRRILHHGLEATKGCYVHIHLKDVGTVQGDPGWLARWVQVARDVIDAC